MGVLLAAVSAALYGSADFMGGLAARRAAALLVTWSSQIIGLVTITAVALVVPAGRVVAGDWGWGAAGGVAGSLGLLLLYDALAQGPMAVVAPVTAVCSAAVPAIVGFAEGDRPAAVTVVGIVLALPAIVLVAGAFETGSGSASARPRLARRVLVESIVAGTMFGLFFVFFAHAGHRSGMWPTVATRLASVSLLSLVMAARRTPGAVGAVRPIAGLVAGAGVLDVGANAVYLAASRLGLLAPISVVAAMYPAATVALARWVLAERLSRPQAVGLALAAASIGLVAAGR